jgi:hypothetical protein
MTLRSLVTAITLLLIAVAPAQAQFWARVPMLPPDMLVVSKAMLLQDGRVLTVADIGNYVGDPGTGTFLQVFDKNAGLWYPQAMKSQWWTSEVAIVQLGDDRLMFAGGRDLGSSNFYTPTTHLYDPASAQWSIAGDVPSYVDATAALMNDGRVIQSRFASPAIFSPVSGSWSVQGSLINHYLESRSSATTLLDGRVLFANGSGYSSSHSELHDPGTGLSVDTGPMSADRAPVSTLLSNGKVLAAGSKSPGTPNPGYTIPDLFDPVTRQWTPTGTIPIPCDGRCLAHLSGSDVLAFGSKVVTAFDATTASWSSSAPSPEPQVRAALAVGAREALVIGRQNAHLYGALPTLTNGSPDFNGDGKSDVLWSDGYQAAIWLMDGTTALASRVILDFVDLWTVSHAADFDGDGKSDLLWRNAFSGGVSLWLMDGVTPKATGEVFADSKWAVSHVGDFNGDGKADLVWRHRDTGETAAWLMQGITVASSATLFSDPSWCVTHVADLNGDHKTDLLWRNASTGETALWLMNGSTPIETSILSGDASWRVSQTGDFNGDGKADLVWRNTLDGRTAIWLMDGTTPLVGDVIFADAAWAVHHVGDFDGNWRSDLVWQHVDNGNVAVWLMNGTATSAAAIISTRPDFYPLHPADYDGDGKFDLFWVDRELKTNAIALMDGVQSPTIELLIRFSEYQSWREVNPRM